MTTDSKPIIIAGAGAVGLTLALALAKKDVAVHVMELRDTPNMASKASTFHPATLDILGRLGVLDAFKKDATPIEAMQYRSSQNEILAELQFSMLSQIADNPIRMHLEQSALCAILLDELRQRDNVEITFNSGVSDLVETDSGVTVICDTADGRKSYEASYVFGCDGAASSVREALKIGYVEKPYPGYVLRLYAQADLEKHLPGLAGVSYIFDGDDSCSLLKMSDCWRIVVRVPPEVPHDVAMSDAWAIDRLKNLLPIEEILPSVISRDVYGAKRRRSLSVRAGRCFLAGDALHLTNTRGGMNLNAGIHDAFALAGPAALAWKTGNATALVKAADERERVAREILLPRTDSNIGTGQERVQRIVKIAQDPALALEFLTEAAMLDMSPLHGMRDAHAGEHHD